MSLVVSVIAPAEYLGLFSDQNPPTLHHVTAQRVLGEPAYRAFFADQSARGATIVVDNGVFDLGEALPADQLIHAAREVDAAEIILPDVIGDGDATVRAAISTANRIGSLAEFRLCAVVHGDTDEQWLRCYDSLVSDPRITSVALPADKRSNPSRRSALATRRQIIDHLDASGLVDRAKIYRLLGLGTTGHLELPHIRDRAWLESVDCATPVILGALGIPMLPGGPFVKTRTPRVEQLGIIDPKRYDLIRANIAVVCAAAACPVRLPGTAGAQ